MEALNCSPKFNSESKSFPLEVPCTFAKKYLEKNQTYFM